MTIHLEATIPAAPERVYELLTNDAKLGEVGDMPGKGGGAEGAYFSLFGGWVSGRQIELAPSERITQAWRMTDWGPGRLFARALHAHRRWREHQARGRSGRSSRVLQRVLSVSRRAQKQAAVHLQLAPVRIDKLGRRVPVSGLSPSEQGRRHRAPLPSPLPPAPRPVPDTDDGAKGNRAAAARPIFPPAAV